MEPVSYNEVKVPVVFSDEGVQWFGDLSSKPEIEQQLFSLQEQYYKTKNKVKQQKIWSEMFVLVQRYSRSLILKKVKGHKFKQPEEVEDKSTQTALAFMSQYINRPGYRVGASFAGMINPKVLESIYKKDKNEETYSLSNQLGDSNLELEDMQKSMNFQSIYDTTYEQPGDFINRISLKDTMSSLIREFNAEVKDEKLQFKILTYMQILLRKPKNKHILPMFLKHITVDKKEYDLVQLFQLELHNRLLESLQR